MTMLHRLLDGLHGPLQNEVQAFQNQGQGFQAPDNNPIADNQDDEVSRLIQIQPDEGEAVNHPENDHIGHLQENEPNQEVQVLAMDELTDTDHEDLAPAVLPVPHVDIVPFPNFNNIQLVLPAPKYMIRLEGLLGFDGNNHPLQNNINNINLEWLTQHNQKLTQSLRIYPHLVFYQLLAHPLRL